MVVRAKFYVQTITRHAGNTGGAEVKLSAVCRGADNKTWAAATPFGQLTMTINNEGAVNLFILGQEYYLDFTEAKNGIEG